MFERTLLYALVVGFLSLTACSDDSGEDGGRSAGSGGGSADAGATGEVSVPAEDCPQRCADKAAACGAPADLVAPQCQSVCGGMLTETELECLEDEDCAALEEALFGSGGACDLGGAGSAGGGSSGGSTPTNADIGDACECSGSNADFESCSGTGSSCGDLTCYVVFGEGICSQSCTADIDGDDCPSGECTEQIINGVSVGVWCVP